MASFFGSTIRRCQNGFCRTQEIGKEIKVTLSGLSISQDNREDSSDIHPII